jgi:hypothetical protein
MQFQFTAWAPLSVRKNEFAVQQWLGHCGEAIKAKFVGGLHGGHSGRWYGIHLASAPGEYPAFWKGMLEAQTSVTLSLGQVEVGSTAPHARFLMGTRKMAKRKMFDNAIQEAKFPAIRRFAQFRGGK